MKYGIIPAPGYTDNVARIASVHRTLKLAQRARGNVKGLAIIECDDGAHKGQKVFMDWFAGHRFCTDGVLRP